MSYNMPCMKFDFSVFHLDMRLCEFHVWSDEKIALGLCGRTVGERSPRKILSKIL